MPASRAVAVVFTALVAVCLLAERPAAQAPPSPSYSLFERYLDALRQQTGIPGLSAAIVQGRRIVWERGFGQRDVESSSPALPDTPYPVGGLTQSLGAVLLGQCAERGALDIDQSVQRWLPEGAPAASTRQLLAHAGTGRFRFDLAQYAQLTAVSDACSKAPFRLRLADEVLERLGMADSAPGTDLPAPSSDGPERSALGPGEVFDAARLERYARVLARMATPYRVDRNGRPSRADVPRRGVDTAFGLVSTVRDLARFENAMADGVLISPESTAIGYSPAIAADGAPLPTGLGWFVQTHGTDRVVWQFGVQPEAHSSLVLKVPGRDLTLILLANSDGLAAGFGLDEGDVLRSPFAALFLRLFVL